MPVLQRVVKPTTHKGKKALIKREPKLIEDPKDALFIKGSTASKYAHDAMKDLYNLKKPLGACLQQKNQILPFEDVTPIEKFCKKSNAPLFMFVSNNKKRPHNLVMGRTFEHTLLDMVEFGIDNYKPLKDYKVEKIAAALKPLLVFNGELFENNHEFTRIKNLLVDMFQREPVDNIRLQGLEHVLSFTAVDNKISLRSYKVQLKKSGTRIPRVELTEIGPRMDLTIRRTKFASDDLFKQACKKPKALKIKKKKNIAVDNLGSTLGRIHLGTQNINSLQTRKMKGLKKTLAERKEERKRKASLAEGESPKKIKASENADINTED
ncbi:ribosome production factor 2 homolog [Diachasmimorpha longicaudata]|uniref:ribosome production factor 2 homolog n=1 Tax=Diachasmimorpha longicaudata TaxID=58733 RepID=UPI0030B8F7FD